MPGENLTIPVGKYDFVWAVHDHATEGTMPPLVVMIHGFPGDSKSYGDVFGDLSRTVIQDGLHTLRFDMRGCGQSDKGAGFFTLRSAHEDCLAVLHWAGRLGYKKFFLVAEGLGGLAALTILTDAIRPKIAGLVFMWPIVDPKLSWLGGLDAPAKEAEAAGADHITCTDPKTGPTRVGLGLVREMGGYDFIPLIRRVSMPAFVLHGADDSKAPATQPGLLKANATTDQLEIVTFSGGGHGLKNPVERDRLLRETRAFFKRNTFLQ